MSTNKYNGWTNYETWCVKLWIDNDEGSYRYWQDRTQAAFDNAEAEKTFTRMENAAFALAAELKDEHEENAPAQNAENSGVYTDLINAALSEVNWHEIAENLLSDIETDEQAPESIATDGSIAI